MIEKLERDGKVAVLYSPGYGAGWSTWGQTDQREQMTFDPVLAQAVLDGKDYLQQREIAKDRYPKEYLGGIDPLEVEWIEKGTKFLIHEYDGAESIWYVEDLEYTA